MSMLYFVTYIFIVTISFASLVVALVFQMYGQIESQRRNGDLYLYVRSKLGMLSDDKMQELMGRMLDTDLDAAFSQELSDHQDKSDDHGALPKVIRNAPQRGEIWCNPKVDVSPSTPEAESDNILERAVLWQSAGAPSDEEHTGPRTNDDQRGSNQQVELSSAKTTELAPTINI